MPVTNALGLFVGLLVQETDQNHSSFLHLCCYPAFFIDATLRGQRPSLIGIVYPFVHTCFQSVMPILDPKIIF